MAEIISCPACDRKLQVPEAYIGQKVQCPQCNIQFIADPHAQDVQATLPATTQPASPKTPPSDNEPQPRRRRPADDEFDDDSYDDDDEFSFRRPRRRPTVPHRGGLILALGLVALVGGMAIWFPLIIGPFAWVMGNNDLNQIRAGRMDPTGEGLVQAGRILGIVATVFLVVVLMIVGTCVGLIFVTRG